MPSVRIKGINRVRKRLKNGKIVEYFYAWKGGPRLEGKPGSPEFMASFSQAVVERKTPSGNTLATLVARYKASPEWAKTSASTKAEWGRWLDKICADAGAKDIGGLPLSALNDRRVRDELLNWRDQWADRPRSADYSMQVLGRVLSWGMNRGLVNLNAASGTEQLYESDRADQIWTDDEIARYQAAAPSHEVGFIVPLACLTGMRRGDLTELTWSQVGQHAIRRETLKSRGRRTQVVPLLRETKKLLAAIKSQQDVRQIELASRATARGRPAPTPPTTVLSNTRNRPWTPDGLENRVIKTKSMSAPKIDKHLHDARGTFATRLRKAGLTTPEIADVLGWEEKRVERLLAKYVDQDAIILDIAERIQRNEKR